MKNLTLLIFIISQMFLLFSCSSTKNNITKKGKYSIEELKLSNFDKKPISKDASNIASMIEIVQPEINPNDRNTYAEQISEAVKEFNVAPQVVIALIDTESDFNSRKISETGDLSIAQINYEVWNKEFKRMKLPEIDLQKLTSEDQSYAINTMVKILSILKKRHAKVDRRWYARYHSNTKKYKWHYLKKIEVRMKRLESETQKGLVAMD